MVLTRTWPVLNKAIESGKLTLSIEDTERLAKIIKNRLVHKPISDEDKQFMRSQTLQNTHIVYKAVSKALVKTSMERIGNLNISIIKLQQERDRLRNQIAIMRWRREIEPYK